MEGKYCSRCGAPAGAGGSPPPPAATGISANVGAGLAYLIGLVTGIIFLLLPGYNRDPLVRFHAWQSIFLHVAFILTMMLLGVLRMILPWSLHGIANMLSVLLSLAFLAGWILAIVKAFQGQIYELPVVGEFARRRA